MNLVLVFKDGEAITVVEDIEEYNLTLPMAQSSVCNEIRSYVESWQEMGKE